MKPRTCLFSIILVFLFSISPIYSAEDDYFVHDIGMLWNRISNYGTFGDRSYFRSEPICTWPRGSGNSYLYTAELYLSGKIGNILKTVKSDNSDFIPLDSIHIIKPGFKADQETYTQYYDKNESLGLLIKERTFAWKNVLADDFIINEYTIINKAENSRDIYDFSFSIYMDADVSRCDGCPPEGYLVNLDDNALSNANGTIIINDALEAEYNGTYSGWEFVQLVPYMKRQLEKEPHLIDSLNTYPLDSLMTFMWDGDSPNYTADDIGVDTSNIPEIFDPNNLDDDTGNPSSDGRLNSPGFIGWRMLKSTPDLKPKSYATLTIHDIPLYYENLNDFNNFKEALNSQYSQWNNGELNSRDYRTITTYSNPDTLKSGDSIVVTIAYGVGCDPIRGGVYSLLELNKIMRMAQYIVDYDYQVDFTHMYDPQIITIGINDGINEQDLSFGWSVRSTDEFDNGIDEYAPIEPDSGSFDARLHHQNEDYIVDLRYPPLGESMVWEFSFRPGTGKDTLNFEWDRTLLPDQGSFLLQDTLTDSIVNIDMRQTGHFVCSSSDFKYLRIVYNINVNVDNGIDIPVKYILNQNYPNPFNPVTTIGYDVYEESNVRLDIYNISGQHVETLIDEYHLAGAYTVKWNASKYSSGIYIYTLKYGDKHISRKMLLIK